MTPQEIKSLKFDVVYHGIKKWYDDELSLTTGYHFVWKITSPDCPNRAEFYLVYDVMTPPKPEENAKNLKSVWGGINGQVMSDDEDGLAWWAEVLRDSLMAARTYEAKGYWEGKKSLALDVQFPNVDSETGKGDLEGDEAKYIVRDITLIDISAFVKRFKKTAQLEIMGTNVRYLIRKSPDALVNMIPMSDVKKVYDDISEIINLVQKPTPTEAEEPEDTTVASLDTLKGPTAEELAAEESGVDYGS